MIKFTYQPWNEIIVHELIKWPLEQFLLTRAIGVPEGGTGPPLIWVDGIVFDREVMPPTPEIIKESLKGKIHWNSLIYGIMDEYREEFVLQGQVKIRVLNHSHNNIFKVMTKWIRENFE